MQIFATENEESEKQTVWGSFFLHTQLNEMTFAEANQQDMIDLFCIHTSQIHFNRTKLLKAMKDVYS